MAATVAGMTSQGQPILATDQGVVVLNTRTPLPQGTQVTIGLPPSRPEPAEPFDPLRGRDWATLRDALEVLARADPGGAKALANAILPQVNPRLAATMMGFFAQVKNGDAKGWLGDKAVKTLEALGRKDLVDKLEDEFRQLTHQAAEPLPGDWKSYSLPFSDWAELSRIQFHVRQPDPEEVGDDDKDGDGQAAKANRFLIDLELSRLGALQLDGLLRPRRFDLILRTRMPLPPDMRGEIGRIFTGQVEALGMTGTVSFQAGTQGWVAVQPGKAGSVGFNA
jgi:hypothetical protein